ncbi:hypothetical protein HPB50_012784 [Hyalomma asiaticum]|uniref:Uncharacterized protein n=1 Tax=Hyalomma asiaticum TaxID=266040 RepID=A0ACB7SGL1_HYAAI|nr:hypothetical protein HPB50_012784 [Hyalomma asiaticum]
MSANFARLTVQALLFLLCPVEGPCFLAARGNAPWKFSPGIASPTAIKAEDAAAYYPFADSPPSWLPTHVTSPTPAIKIVDDPYLLRRHGGIRGSITGLEHLERLMSTDIKQAWGKLKATPLYSATELKNLCHVQAPPPLHPSEQAKKGIRQRMMAALPESALAQHFRGRQGEKRKLNIDMDAK